MNMKLVLAALAATVAAFLLGWAIYGMVLADYMKGATNHFAGFEKPEENWSWLSLIASNAAYGSLLAYALMRMGVTSAVGAMLPSLVIGLLCAASFDLMMHAMTNMYYDRMFIAVDVLASGVMSALVGAVAGMVLGSGKKG